MEPRKVPFMGEDSFVVVSICCSHGNTLLATRRMKPLRLFHKHEFHATIKNNVSMDQKFLFYLFKMSREIMFIEIFLTAMQQLDGENI